MGIVVWIAGIAVALFVLDRLFLWFESKGWLYWRKVKRKGAGGGGLIGFSGMFEPGARHLAEAREEKTIEEDEDDGDDDGDRTPDDRVS
ncbi:MAG: hypothetical protein ABI740_08180 [Alphaproteobacteria bacterium]